MACSIVLVHIVNEATHDWPCMTTQIGNYQLCYQFRLFAARNTMELKIFGEGDEADQASIFIHK